jgi:hypothetical protein
METNQAIRALAWDLINMSQQSPRASELAAALGNAIRSQGQLPTPEAADAALEVFSSEAEQEDLGHHECERSESWAEYDAQGIYLCRVCDICVESKLSKYRPEILTGYGQNDVLEPIDPEE